MSQKKIRSLVMGQENQNDQRAPLRFFQGADHAFRDIDADLYIWIIEIVGDLIPYTVNVIIVIWAEFGSRS